jgi:hypothetical protein
MWMEFLRVMTKMIKDDSIFKGDFKNGLRHGYGMCKGPVIKINKSLKHHS